MKVLVTGARGFVGSAMVRRLIRDGREVIAGLHQDAPYPMDCARVVLGDLSSKVDRRALLANVGCVVHAAARVHVMDEQESDPLEAFRAVNVAGTVALAEQAIEAGVSRFVFVSSIKVNGESTAAGAPFTSAQPPSPEDPYGVSKLEAERALMDLGAKTGLQVVVVRPPLVYGPGVKANFRALMGLLTRGLPLPFGAIHNCRSLVGLDNLVDLLSVCVDHPSASAQTFLVSDDQDISTSGLLRDLATALEVKPRLVPLPRSVLLALASLVGQSGRMRRLCDNLQVDIAHTKLVLGWRPPTSLQQGLRATARDYLNEASR